MSYYRTCPHCGAHLAPGERCDCLEAQREWAKSLIAQLTPQERDELWEFVKNIPASAANTDGDRVEQIKTANSTVYDSRKEGGLQDKYLNTRTPEGGENTVKNLDVIAQEQREQEEARKLLAEVQQSGPQPDEAGEQPLAEQGGGRSEERLYTGEEVRRIVAEAVAQEQAHVKCREFFLTHYYDGMELVSDELDRVLRILEPKSVEELAKKMEEIEALDSVEGTTTHTTGTYPKSSKTSLRQIFVRN